MQGWFDKNGYQPISKKYFDADKINQSISDLRKELNHFKKDLKELDEEVISLVQKINQILIRHHIGKLKLQLDSMMEDAQEEDQWHSLRKLIKQWIYSINWIENIDQKELASFQKLQEMIGNWHDLLALQEWLHVAEKELKENADLHHAFAMARAKSQLLAASLAKQIRVLLH